MNSVRIPDNEYLERVDRCAKMLQKHGLDAMLVTGSEGDFQNIKYFTGVTPIWERLGVIITATGKAAMISGPEGLTYCKHYSKLDQIYALTAFRSSMDPIPGSFFMHSFPMIFSDLGLRGKFKIALGNPIDTTVTILEALHENIGDAELSYAPSIMRILRAKKSENEIACLKESYRLCEMAIDECLSQMKPGMTECNVLGIAHSVIFANGAETEGMPNYVFSDLSTRYPLGRASTYNIFENNSFIQLGLSASVDGYCGSIGVPVSMGKFSSRQRDLIDFGLIAHNWVRENAKAGIEMKTFAAQYKKLFIDAGMAKHYVYSALHGVGLAEVEEYRPLDNSNNYVAKIDYTYQTDCFLLDDDFGFRWETGIVLKESGNDLLSRSLGDYYELGY